MTPQRISKRLIILKMRSRRTTKPGKSFMLPRGKTFVTSTKLVNDDIHKKLNTINIILS